MLRNQLKIKIYRLFQNLKLEKMKLSSRKLRNKNQENKAKNKSNWSIKRLIKKSQAFKPYLLLLKEKMIHQKSPVKLTRKNKSNKNKTLNKRKLNKKIKIKNKKSLISLKKFLLISWINKKLVKMWQKLNKKNLKIFRRKAIKMETTLKAWRTKFLSKQVKQKIVKINQ